MKRNLIMRILGYILYSALALFITVQIGIKTVDGRKGKYQAKYVTEWYKKAGTTTPTPTVEEIKKSNAYHARYLLEGIALRGGILNTVSIKRYSVKESDYTKDGKKPANILTFDLAIYQFAIPGKNTRHGFLAYFESFKHGILQEDKTYKYTDLTFRGKNKELSIFDKKFKAEDSFKRHIFKIHFEFSKPYPLLLTDTKAKEKNKNANIVNSIINPSNPLYLDDLGSLLAEKGKTYKDNKYSEIENIRITYVDEDTVEKANSDDAKLVDLVTISKGDDKTNSKSLIKFNDLNLSHDVYKLSDDDIKNANLVSKEKGTDENPILPKEGAAKNFVKLNLNKCLNEFNTIPALTITVVILLVLTATYFLFVHKIVMKKVKETRAAKKAEKEESKENIQDADFTELKDENELVENTDSENNENLEKSKESNTEEENK